MADETTPVKSDWERGKDALETILKYVPIAKVEALARKIETDTDFRNGMMFKMFINSLK